MSQAAKRHQPPVFFYAMITKRAITRTECEVEQIELQVTVRKYIQPGCDETETEQRRGKPVPHAVLSLRRLILQDDEQRDCCGPQHGNFVEHLAVAVQCAVKSYAPHPDDGDHQISKVIPCLKDTAVDEHAENSHQNLRSAQHTEINGADKRSLAKIVHSQHFDAKRTMENDEMVLKNSQMYIVMS